MTHFKNHMIRHFQNHLFLFLRIQILIYQNFDKTDQLKIWMMFQHHQAGDLDLLHHQVLEQLFLTWQFLFREDQEVHRQDHRVNLYNLYLFPEYLLALQYRDNLDNLKVRIH